MASKKSKRHDDVVAVWGESATELTAPPEPEAMPAPAPEWCVEIEAGGDTYRAAQHAPLVTPGSTHGSTRADNLQIGQFIVVSGKNVTVNGVRLAEGPPDDPCLLGQG